MGKSLMPDVTKVQKGFALVGLTTRMSIWTASETSSWMTVSTEPIC